MILNTDDIYDKELELEELSEQQLNRQDLVDNLIFKLVQLLNPSKTEIEWNIEMLGDIRDQILYWLCNRLELCTEQEFYPYIEE